MPIYSLIAHGAVMSVIMIAMLLLLLNRRLFAPDSTGFWVWVAFSICFVINPVTTLVSSDYSTYEYYTRGTYVDDARVLWVLLNAAVGVIVFFAVYLKTQPGSYTAGSTPISPTALAIVVTVFMAIGWNAILSYRINENAERIVVNAKFVGSVSGWQSDTHGFVIFPCLLLIASKKYRILGLIIGLLYIVVRFNDTSDRFSILMLPLAAFMYFMIKRGRRWPSLAASSIAVALLFFLVARGHEKLEAIPHSELDVHKIVNDALKNIGRGADTSMLPTFYRETDLVEQHGYTYGAGIVQEILFAPLPRPYFPWKDDVFSFIPGVSYRNESWSADVYGAKSTIVCSFYGYGGIIGVIIGMACLGYLLRKLDGLLRRDTPFLALVWAVMVLTTIWLGVLGSIEWWYKAVMLCSMPLFALIILNKMVCALAPAGRLPAPAADGEGKDWAAIAKRGRHG
jgi:hypothetical protein